MRMVASSNWKFGEILGGRCGSQASPGDSRSAQKSSYASADREGRIDVQQRCSAKGSDLSVSGGGSRVLSTDCSLKQAAGV